VLFPLFWHFADQHARTSSTLLVPFYWSSAGSERTRGILPVAWYSRDPVQGSGSTALLPLFYESHGRDRFTLLTAAAGYRRTATSHLWYFATALFSDSVVTRFRMVAPLWFNHTNKVTETTTTVVPPLLYVSRGNPESGLATFAAIFWRHHDIGSSTTLGIPLYFDVHEFHQSRTTVLFPLFIRYRRDSDHSVYSLAPLFYRHWTPTDSTTVAFPLYWDWKRGPERTTIVFPLYARWRRPGYVSTYVFPTYYRRQGLRPDGTPDGTYQLVLLPLYDSAVKRPGDFKWEVLGGLFGHERIGRHRYMRLFWMNFETGASAPSQTAWYGQRARTPRRQASRGLSMNSW
jgi:hypothetical protein